MNDSFVSVFKNRASHSFMDVKSVDDIIASAKKALREGNYKGTISMLEPLLKGEKKKTLSPKQEMDVHHIVCGA